MAKQSVDSPCLMMLLTKWSSIVQKYQHRVCDHKICVVHLVQVLHVKSVVSVMNHPSSTDEVPFVFCRLSVWFLLCTAHVSHLDQGRKLSILKNSFKYKMILCLEIVRKKTHRLSHITKLTESRHHLYEATTFIILYEKHS